MRVPQPSPLAARYLAGLADREPLGRAELVDLATMSRITAARLQSCDPDDVGSRARLAGRLAMLAIGALESAIRPHLAPWARGEASPDSVEGCIVVGRRVAAVRECSCNFCGYPQVAIDEGDGSPAVIFDAPGDGTAGWLDLVIHRCGNQLARPIRLATERGDA